MKTAMMIFFSALCCLLIASGLFGCPVPTPEPPGKGLVNELDGAPEWVRKGCNGLKGDEAKKMVCAVGSVGSTANVSLAREGAVGRARAEIARQLQTKVKTMLKDYSATTTGGGQYGKSAEDAQHLEATSRQVAEETLSGSEMIDTWTSNSGTVYTLVAVKVDKFKGLVSGMKGLSEEIRKAVVDRAEKAFQELDAAPATSAPSEPKP